MVHPSWPGFVKIGKARNPTRRLITYQTGDPLRRYSLAWTIFTPDYHETERLAHLRLALKRVGWTEWFETNPEDAFHLLRDLANE